MNIEQINEIINGKFICKGDLSVKFEQAFASDLMSDVLALESNIMNFVLITGLSNIQTIRTAEIADIKSIIFCRKKKVNEEMILLAEDLGLNIIECRYSLYKTSALLFNAGLKPIF